MNSFKMDKRKILWRISRGLKWDNKPLKLKRSIWYNTCGIKFGHFLKLPLFPPEVGIHFCMPIL